MAQTLSMSDIHAMVASGEWHFREFHAAMSHLSVKEAVEQYVAVLRSAQ